MGLVLALEEPRPLVVSPPRGLTRSAQCSTCGLSLGGLLGHHSCALALDFNCFVLCCRCLARCFMAGARLFSLVSRGLSLGRGISRGWALLLCVKGSAKKTAPCGLLSAWLYMSIYL
jgi:hypothetical protein